jgi:hypothetical protein
VESTHVADPDVLRALLGALNKEIPVLYVVASDAMWIVNRERDRWLDVREGKEERSRYTEVCKGSGRREGEGEGGRRKRRKDAIWIVKRERNSWLDVREEGGEEGGGRREEGGGRRRAEGGGRRMEEGGVKQEGGERKEENGRRREEGGGRRTGGVGFRACTRASEGT